MSSPHRLLIVRTDRLGDLLMNLPAIHAIRREMPGAEIHLLARTELHPLLKSHPDLDCLHGFEPGQERGWRSVIQTALWLRRHRFDAILVMNPSRCFHIASLLAGVPLRIGYRRKLGFLLNRSLPDTKSERTLHESQYNLELVRLLGIPAEADSNSLPALPLHSQTEQGAQDFLKRHGILRHAAVAIHPWTSNPQKGWGLEHFAALTPPLAEAGHPVLLLGGPQEAARREQWRELFPSSCVDAVGRLPLELLPSVLRRCALLISNDSGPAHVAAAVGTPVVVVAPREHERQMQRWRPLGNSSRILLSPTVEEILTAARSFLVIPSGSQTRLE